MEKIIYKKDLTYKLYICKHSQISSVFYSQYYHLTKKNKKIYNNKFLF